jgi:hypothetical protein
MDQIGQPLQDNVTELQPQLLSLLQKNLSQFATSGLELAPFDSAALNVIDANGARVPSDSGVNGSPADSIY